MCGRFVSSSPPSALAEQFLVDEVKAPDLEPRWNVAPTDEVYAVAASKGVRRLGTFSWGLVPNWAKSPKQGPRLINLRAETVSEKAGFRRTLQRHRCIIPADGFYEWKVLGEGRPKRPFFVRRRDGLPLALAGLWAAWKDPEDQDAEWLRTCTILTTEPNELVAPVHDRMPAVLADAGWARWLDEQEQDVEALAALLRPFPAELMEMWPVGTDVNRVQNDGPGLVEPLAGHDPSPLALFDGPPG